MSVSGAVENLENEDTETNNNDENLHRWTVCHVTLLALPRYAPDFAHAVMGCQITTYGPDLFL